jgi:SAM-dependent methyltransferase
MSYEFLKLQVKLEKTGKYLFSTFEEVENEVYSQNSSKLHGPDYLWGLYFSEIFWKIHHGFTNFFLDEFTSQKLKKGKVLEVPSGTGFFLSEFLRINPEWYGMGVDLADTAIDFSKKIFAANKISDDSYSILKEDFLKFSEGEKFDRIICGEFLEHLEDPLIVLNKIKRILKDNGKVFITVAVWAAHIDHIYLYKNATEVRDHLHRAGFNIEKELVQAVFERDKLNPEKAKIPVSYAAVLSKL